MSDNFSNIEEYLPDYGSLSVEEVRQRFLVALRACEHLFPDIDARPGSPLGDLWLTPAAYREAALSKATDRILSDFDLNQVRKGIIYNCRFVENYLSSLGVGQQTIVPATGVLELHFSTTGPHTIPSNTIFSDDGETVLQATGDFPDGTITFGGAGIPLHRVATNVYSAHLPVSGRLFRNGDELPEIMPSGTELLSDFESPPMILIVTFSDINPGFPPQTLPERAKLVPHVFPGLNTNTPAGIASWVRMLYPQTSSASAVVDGDRGMLRSTPSNILDIHDGKLDLYVRGNALRQETIYVKVTAQDGNLWAGGIEVPYVPLSFDNIRDVAGEPIPSMEIISEASHPGKLAPGDDGYSGLQTFAVQVDYAFPAAQKTPGSDPAEAWVLIDVLSDPLHLQVTQRLGRRDYRPVAGNVLVRPYIPAFLPEIKIYYRRRGNGEIDKVRCIDEIYSYINSCGYPNVFETTTLGEIVLYWGAAGVSRVETTWLLRENAATHYIDTSSVKQPSDVHTLAELPSSDGDYPSLFFGPRNIAPIVRRNAIRLLAI